MESQEEVSKREMSSHVERSDVESPKDQTQTGMVSKSITQIMGTVKLTENTIVYIPTPTADPRDPLNMSLWQKFTIVIIISIFSVLGLSLNSGFGGLLGFYHDQYINDEGRTDADLLAMITWPNLFMGIGNLIGMPIAYAVGRRVVLLGSTVILVVTAALCAAATNYEYHLWARCTMGLAAGQSEALVPMVAQEIFFLHERSQALMVQLAAQVVLTSVWILFASPIAGAITPQWWYGLGAILAGVQCVATFFLVPETKYNRSLESFQETTSKESNEKVEYCTERPPLDPVNFAPRTWKSDLALWVGEPEWKVGLHTIHQTFSCLALPQVFWAMAVNGLTLGVNVAIGMTYAAVVTSAPYNWPQSSASYANCGQIVTALVALPIFGKGSDALIKWFAKRRGGVHEPETRLITLILPTIVGVFTSIIYGLGAENPHSWHWFTYVWAIAAYYFCFIGANITAITYLLDSYPTRTGPLLIIICAFRGFVSFGVDYEVSHWVDSQGYAVVFGVFGGLTGGLALFGIPIYIWGKQLRQYTTKFVTDVGK